MQSATYYIVHSASCSRCEHIAQEVERISAGSFRAMSQNDPLVTQAVSHSRLDLPVGEPFILVSQSDGSHSLVKGGAMARLVAVKIGIRPSLEIAKLLRPTQFATSRRGVLVGGIATGLAAAGWMLGLPSIAAAASGTGQLPDGEADKQFTSISKNKEVRQAVDRLKDAGYDVNERNVKGVRMSDGATILAVVFASLHDRANDAGLVLIRQAGEEVEVRAGGTSRPGTHPVEAARAGGTAAPMGVSEFMACVIGLVGASCASQIESCLKFTVAGWYAVVACILGSCGTDAVSAAWDCKGAL